VRIGDARRTATSIRKRASGTTRRDGSRGIREVPYSPLAIASVLRRDRADPLAQFVGAPVGHDATLIRRTTIVRVRWLV
jgi:hypothetical protein